MCCGRYPGNGLCADINAAPDILEEMAEHLFNLFDANCMDECAYSAVP